MENKYIIDSNIDIEMGIKVDLEGTEDDISITNVTIPHLGKTIEVKIPNNIQLGQIIRVKGFGKIVSDYQKGDLYLRIDEIKYLDTELEVNIEIEDNNTDITLPVSVPYLHKVVNVNIPSSIKEGQKIRLKGLGYADTNGNKGNLYLKVNKVVKRFATNDVNKDKSIKSGLSGASVGGVVYGNISNASSIYGNDKFATPRGHGFAAEQANHLHDKIINMDFLGQDNVKLVGEDRDPSTNRIIKNGADRVVNGTNIQTKYCNSGGKCISECFENGQFRYWNSDGSPMQIEVPSDKYDAAIQAMENRIKKGQMAGITDPKEAKNIIRKGHFTYEQAKNIAKAGTVESLCFDAANGAVIATGAFGVSTVLSFATSVWNGETLDIAIKNATTTGLKVGGTAFITSILASQLSKAGLNSVLKGSSDAIVKLMGPKASAMIANAFRSGSNIYGAAAMTNVSKMLKGNIITSLASVVVLSSADIVNIFRGRISGKQLFKNVVNTASGVAGGTAGWFGGAAAGATIGSAIPIVGTVIGGAVGGLLGSIAAGTVTGKVSDTILGTFIEDDAEEMVSIIEKIFQQLAIDYLLNQSEAENMVDNLKKDLTGKVLKDMFASSNRENFARNLLIPHMENEIRKRQIIVMPSEGEMREGLRRVLEELSDLSVKEEFGYI